MRLQFRLTPLGARLKTTRSHRVVAISTLLFGFLLLTCSLVLDKLLSFYIDSSSFSNAASQIWVGYDNSVSTTSNDPLLDK